MNMMVRRIKHGKNASMPYLERWGKDGQRTFQTLGNLSRKLKPHQ